MPFGGMPRLSKRQAISGGEREHFPGQCRGRGGKEPLCASCQELDPKRPGVNKAWQGCSHGNHHGYLRTLAKDVCGERAELWDIIEGGIYLMD